jgi:pyruvate dehydrogenase E1 component
MLERQEDVFFYLTLMNENYVHATMPDGAEEGIICGMYLVRPSRLAVASPPRGGMNFTPRQNSKATNVRSACAGSVRSPRVQLVWSVTSFTELRRSGLEIERWNRLNPTRQPQLSWVEKCLGSTTGPVIAATDYVRAVPDLIRTWVPRRYITLGTDGFGRSDTREALRRFFEVDRNNIALAAISALADDGLVGRSLVSQFMTRHSCTPPVPPPWGDKRCNGPLT